MISSDRRHPSVPKTMAWRAAPRGHVPPRINVELLRFAALLLPLVVGALVILQLLDLNSWTSPLVPVLGCTIACAAAILSTIDSRQRLRPLVPAVRIVQTAMPGILAPTAIALSLGAALLTTQNRQPVAAAVLWAGAVCLLLIHAVVLERPHIAPPTPIDAAALIGLVSLTLLLRLPYLGMLPDFVHSDEAQMGLHVRLALAGGMPSLFGTTDWWSVPWLGPAMQVPLMLIFGEGLTALRLASVLYAVVAVAGLWFLGTELWGRRAGFVAALLFSVMAPSVHFGRDGVHYMQAIAALVLTVLAYTRATKRYSGAYAALTGVLIGIDVQLYYAARLAVPLVFLHAVICALLDRGLLRNWLRLILWTTIGLLVTFLPMAAFYLLHPEALQQRTDAVFLFSGAPEVRAAIALDYGHAGWLEILGRQIQRVVLGFLARGDRSEQYGSTYPLLDPVTAALLPAAIALGLARLRQSPWLLCLLWVLITVSVGGVLTTLQPDAPRLLAAIPAICLLIGGLAHTLLNAAGETHLRDAKPLLALGLAGALVAASLANFNVYVGAYAATEAEQPVTLITDVGRFLATQPPTVPVVLYDQRQFYLAHWTIQLLAPAITGTTVWNAPGLESALAAIHGPFLFLAVDTPPAILAHVRQEYSAGHTVTVLVHTAHDWVTAYAYTGGGLS